MAITSLLLLSALLPTADLDEARTNALAKTASSLEAAVERSRSYDDAGIQLAVLETAFVDVQRWLPEGTRTRQRVESLLRGARGLEGRSLARAAEFLERNALEIAADLQFEPLVEAELAEGWPAPTQVGEIELKSYPRYRMAQTQAGSRGNTAFWKLFRHIESNGIAMTAPVQMDYDSEGRGARESNMAFLYSSREIGAVGKEGPVMVRDIEPLNAISMGMRGYSSNGRIEAAAAELREWIDASPLYEAAGEMRVMGWNSPMVRENRRYFEVQIPVQLVKVATPAALRG